MSKIDKYIVREHLTPFDRHFFNGKEKFTYIGDGSLGGKAQGLANMKEILESRFKERFQGMIDVNIPTLTVITTEFFDKFMEQNDLYDFAYTEARHDIIAHEFQKAELPASMVGDLRALIEQVHTPLAIRSSSMLEDIMFEPFASVYTTKMIPNNQFDADTRFHKLVEAVKFIYASTFFGDAKNYMLITKHATKDEKMAVVIQEIVGQRYDDRFYPNISGVIRSYNFYPTGNAHPEQGVVDLALGLGKSIVDDGNAWSYSPAYPMAYPPVNSIKDMLKQTQTEFWGVNMGKPPAYNPIKETEYMFKYSLKDAEIDGTLDFIASTYQPQNDRIVIGTYESGPRILNFGPILHAGIIPLNDLLKIILKMCEDTLEVMVEIEFAVTLDKKNCLPARFGFLQVRPMVVSTADVQVTPEDLTANNLLLSSESVIGNGINDTICDIVYVKPEKFDAKHTPAIAEELEIINRGIVETGKNYLLVGFGRWGTSDPQCGIPVKFGQISGAKAIIESTLPDMNFVLSQGSHFFHNVTSFKIFYFSVYHWSDKQVDWEWLKKQPIVEETDFVCHAQLTSPLKIKVDGKAGRGVICYE